MKAIVYHAPGDLRFEEVPTPSPAADELLVKVDACAVCGTDLKSFKVGNPRIKPPLTMGHEFTGLVESVGVSASGGFQVGDRVVMATSVSCGQCYYCQRGWPNLCAELAPMGFTYAGGMAEYVIIPARALRNGHAVRVPRGVPAAHAALAEPLSCAMNAVDQCAVRAGDTVLVMGAGPMGLMNACVARAMGASTIILSETNSARLEQARDFGCDVLVNPLQQDLKAVVMEQTQNRGADVAIVAAPAAAPQEQAMHLVRKRGAVCLFASLPLGQAALNVDSRAIHYGELRVIGSSDSTPAHVAKAVEMMAAGRIPVARLVTHVLPLDQIRKAFELMISGEALRVVLTP